MRANPKPMPKKTLTALCESIEHWKRMRRLRTKEQRDDSTERPDRKSCALCGLFNKFDSASACRGCPVKKHTGAQYCEYSPFSRASWAFAFGSERVWRRWCDAEIAFLESLLPETFKQEGGK